MDRIIRLFTLSALTFAIVLAVGCVEVPIESVPDWLRPTDVEEVDTDETVADDTGDTWIDGRDEHGREMPYGAHDHGAEILMMGRSVMSGWFEHWGWDWEHAVLREGYALYYGELATPPDVADTAIDYIQRAPETTVVFFKLCFADFWADSPDDVEANLAENVGYVERVVEAAEAHGITIILGTALPETASNTTVSLAELHSRYNAAIQDIAVTREGVLVFDLHDILSNPSGVLYKGFAVMPGDAHLTDTAYFELDERFSEFLDANLAVPE